MEEEMKRAKFFGFLLLGLILAVSPIFAGGDQQSGGAAQQTGGGAQQSGGSAAAAAAVDVNPDGTVNNPEAVAVDTNKLVFWSLFSGGDGAWMDRIIADYNKTNPAKQVQSIMLVWGDYYMKLGTAVAARKGPDIGVSHVSRLPELVEQGMIISIDDQAAKAGIKWSDYPPALINSITFNGKKYAIPLDTHAEVQYSNIDILNAAGVQNNKGQITVANWNELKAILDKIKPVLKPGQTALSLTNTGDDPYRIWWAVYFQMGGTALTNTAGNQVTVDRAIAIRAADFVKSLWTDGYILPGITDHGQIFRAGDAALLWTGTWNTGANSEVKGLNFGAQAFPRLYGTNDACWADAHVFVIPTKQARNANDTQASVAFAYWAGTTGAPTWAQSGQIPSYNPVLTSPAFTALPYRADYAKAASTAVLPSQHVKFGAMKDAIIRNLDTIWTGQATTAAAIDKALSDLASAIKN
jgi:multiple sugar transport system substrate-binding protein